MQFQVFWLLLVQCRGEPFHLFIEWLVVLLDQCRTHIAGWGQHVIVFAYLIQRCRFAETGYVDVPTCILVSTPRVVGSGDLCDVGFRKLPVNTIYQRAHLSCVYEKRFSAAVAEPTVPLVAR